MKYTTRHLQTFFGISHQTAKNYAAEFAAYLSPSATPEPNRQRHFTDEDLTVLALVVEMKRSGAVFEDIHAALRAGQRGDLPQDTAMIPAPGAAMLLLQEKVMALSQRISDLERETAMKDGQIALLKEQLADANREIRKLERERDD